MKLIFIAVMILSGAGENAEAKVFNLKKRVISTYLRGTFALPNAGRAAFEPGFPATVSFPDFGGVNQAFSGEIGMAFHTGVSTRLGVEVVYPQYVNQLEGKNAGQTTLLSVTSQVYSVIPQISLEIPMKASANYRVFLGGGVGYAVTVLKNSVSLNAAGQATLGVQDYIEEGTSYSIMGHAEFGVEFGLVDNVGFSLEAGYRYLQPSKFTANRDAITARGALQTGQDIKNIDNSNRSINLSGPFAAAMFRFYIY
ncbi:MAG: hypothetical protein IT289_09105 [Oligoflexia bacterium]|nr:hypothetical protein [Oligoflexia bacterium]